VQVLTTLTSFSDDQGNVIEYDGMVEGEIKIKFKGNNNRLTIHPGAKIQRLFVDFDCDNGVLTIDENLGGPPFRANIRGGQHSTVPVGKNVSATSAVAISATEGTTVSIGDDVMFASENEVRADDGHPIFDVRTEKRVNVSRSITIGNHVWVAREAVLLGGATIGEGSVIGYRSLVTGKIPNNCIAVGIPAKVVRKSIAWERPHLSLIKPYYKPDSRSIKKSPYWNVTEGDIQVGPRLTPKAILKRARRVAGKVKRRLQRR